MDWATAEPFGMHIATNITEYINVFIFTEIKRTYKKNVANEILNSARIVIAVLLLPAADRRSQNYSSVVQ